MVKFSNNLSSHSFAPEKYRISVKEYHRMGRLGFFKNIPKVELIDGEIYTMSLLTPDHAAHTKKISSFFNKILDGKATIGSQDAIQLNDHSEPEPDISILRLDENFYQSGHPTPDDIFLLVEVSVFTVSYDRKVKLKNYAASNIPEYWMVIPQKEKIEVYRKPKNGKYTEKKIYQKEDKWTFKTFNLKVKGSDFLI